MTRLDTFNIFPSSTQHILGENFVGTHEQTRVSTVIFTGLGDKSGERRRRRLPETNIPELHGRKTSSFSH